MNRTLGALLVSLTLAILVAPLATDAQQPAKGPRVGWLSDGMRAGATSRLHEAFLHGLRDLGYVEGQNLVIERRDAEGKLERLPDLAAQLVGLKVQTASEHCLRQCGMKPTVLDQRNPSD
jgi:putative tryptophan/tyrosine transport system substrate-binding protein